MELLDDAVVSPEGVDIETDESHKLYAGVVEFFCHVRADGGGDAIGVTEKPSKEQRFLPQKARKWGSHWHFDNRIHGCRGFWVEWRGHGRNEYTKCGRREARRKLGRPNGEYGESQVTSPTAAEAKMVIVLASKSGSLGGD